MEQAKYSLNKNLVTRALGIEAVVPPDIAEYRAEAEDIYVLCSDGLTDMVDADVVQEIIAAKRSDLAAVLGAPTQDQPFYFHDLERRNKPVKSLDAKILKAPIRICAECNTTRTQPHDRAWEQMSARLR